MGIQVITTVVTAAESQNLITLADLKADLAITGVDQDAWLSRCIARASLAISNYCNRTFAAETVQEQIFPDRDPYPYQVPGARTTIALSRFPVLSVTSLTEYRTELTQGEDFLVIPQSGQLLRLTRTTGLTIQWLTWPLTVVYTGGYTTIPADLQDACSRLVKKMNINRLRDSSIKAEEVEGVGRTEWWIATGDEGGNLPPDIADLIDNYRTPVTM